jgi:hypothetical protein
MILLKILNVNTGLERKALKMAEYGTIFTRIPKRVYSKQWTPFSNLPNVVDVLIDIPQPPPQQSFDPKDILRGSEVENYFSQGSKMIRVCTHGRCTLGNGQTVQVNPRDFVLYNEKSFEPIGVIPESDFMEMYTDKFELCPTCLAKSEFLRMGGRIPHIDELIKMIENGTEIPLDNGKSIKTVPELIEFANLNGINILPPK